MVLCLDSGFTAGDPPQVPSEHDNDGGGENKRENISRDEEKEETSEESRADRET